ncbi:hypothetical protein Dimus_017474 [Dionaea muscipula]
MYYALRVRAPSTAIDRTTIKSDLAGNLFSRRQIGGVRLRPRRFTAASLQLSEEAAAFQPSVSSQLTSSVGSPPSSPPHLCNWTLSQRHLILLNVIACATAVSATWLFCSAIPTLLAFKRAAESLEKLLDVTREELPDTMTAIRLSGMEISDLTTELSDLGQEITQGVRSSTRAVRVAEERLRGLTNNNRAAPVQEIGTQKNRTAEPVVARTMRHMREGVVKGRGLLRILFTVSHLSRFVVKYFATRAKK